MKSPLLTLFTLTIVALLAPHRAWAVQFPTLDPNYSQSIYTAPLYTATIPHEGGFAWTSAGNLLTRTGNVINQYNLTPNTNVFSTNVRSATPNPVPGLFTTGVGMTNGLDGWVYTATGGGLQRFDPNNLATPAQNLTGTVGGDGWGITTLFDGRIAYSDGTPGNVYVYTPNANPNLGTNVQIYPGTTLIDGMISGPGGLIAVAKQQVNAITVMTSTGTPVLTFSTGSHHPDGLAFGSITNPLTIYSNNNDGSVTKYDFSAGYASLLNATDIAYTSGAYGDLAAVGPDCAFYVSQYENGGLNGSIAGVGTHWGEPTTTVTDANASYIRIALMVPTADGTPPTVECCGFYTPLETGVPEPASLALLAPITLTLLRRRRRA